MFIQEVNRKHAFIIPDYSSCSKAAANITHNAPGTATAASALTKKKRLNENAVGACRIP